MLEVPVAVWTFAGGVGVTAAGWGLRHLISSSKKHASTRQQLHDHLKECGERYQKMDGRMNQMDQKLDKVADTSSRNEGKLDAILQHLNGSGKSSHK